MKETDRHGEILQNYSEENLTRIARFLVSLYKEKRHGELLRLYAGLRAEIPELPDRQDPQSVFAALLKRFHPDRRQYFLDRLDQARATGDSSTLRALGAIDRLRPVPGDRMESEYAPDFEEASPNDFADLEPDEDLFDQDWRYGPEDFDEVRETADPDSEEAAEDCQRGFLDALRMEEQGLANDSIGPELLGSLSGSLDLSGYEIDSLRGLEFCTGLTALNLSSNEITDLEEIVGLVRLEELNVSENRIADIRPLGGLIHLREIDLSFNAVRDLTPLTDLPALEFVNLVGNPVASSDPVETLRERGVIVVL